MSSNPQIFHVIWCSLYCDSKQIQVYNISLNILICEYRQFVVINKRLFSEDSLSSIDKGNRIASHQTNKASGVHCSILDEFTITSSYILS